MLSNMADIKPKKGFNYDVLIIEKRGDNRGGEKFQVNEIASVTDNFTVVLF